jgi:citrate synthase
MRNKQIFRILGKIPTIAACAYRHRIGRPYNNPVNDLSYAENFLYMLDRLSETDYRPHPVLVKSLEKMWILHAEHELNCSTATMRQLSSTLVDPYTAVAGAAAALYGPLHGGANEAVLRMLEQIGDVKNIPAFIEEVKAKKRKLFGFGHRVYKNYDPRATIMKQIARDIFELLGTSPLWEIALVLEQTALKDEYFVTRKLYPNVDFYSGIIYNAMGFPTDMFPGTNLIT